MHNYIVGKDFVDLVIMVRPDIADCFVLDFFVDIEVAELSAEAFEMEVALEKLANKV